MRASCAAAPGRGRVEARRNGGGEYGSRRARRRRAARRHLEGRSAGGRAAAHAGGMSVATASATIAAGCAFLQKWSLTPREPLPEGDYVLRVGARSGAAVIPARESLRLHLPAAPNAAAIWIHAEGRQRQIEGADCRPGFRRSEQVRRRDSDAGIGARPQAIIGPDRQGAPAPVTAAVRDDADGSRWITAQLALACWPQGTTLWNWRKVRSGCSPRSVIP